MARQEIYTCDMCGFEGTEKMHDLAIGVHYGNLCKINKHVAASAANSHVCPKCATLITDAVNQALFDSVPLKLRHGWK